MHTPDAWPPWSSAFRRRNGGCRVGLCLTAAFDRTGQARARRPAVATMATATTTSNGALRHTPTTDRIQPVTPEPTRAASARPSRQTSMQARPQVGAIRRSSGRSRAGRPRRDRPTPPHGSGSSPSSPRVLTLWPKIAGFRIALRRSQTPCQAAQRSGDGRHLWKIATHPGQVQRLHHHHQIGLGRRRCSGTAGTGARGRRGRGGPEPTGCVHSWDGPPARGCLRCARRSGQRRQGPAAWPPPSATALRCRCTPCRPPAAHPLLLPDSHRRLGI